MKLSMAMTANNWKTPGASDPGRYNYTIYSKLIHMLLQAEKHDELLAKNGSQRPVGPQPLPEVHMNVANG